MREEEAPVPRTLVIVLTALTVLLGIRAHARADDAPPAFRVVIDESVGIDGPISGRLVVYLLHADSPLYRGSSALDAPFFSDPQPMFGVDVEGVSPGDELLVGDDATAFPHLPSELRPGYYRVGAVLDRSRAHSDWRREAGNLYSEEFTLEVRPDAVPDRFLILLKNVTEPRAFPEDIPGLHLVEVRSALLSDFHGEERTLRAGVLEPTGAIQSPAPTVYIVPGFGGDHFGAVGRASMRADRRLDDPARMVDARAYTVVLDPEGPNGHHLFVDSANNGPVGRALVEELIPAIEERFPRMRTSARQRVIHGHSSGGWSALHLALNYPDTFGACWSSAPDPVDFRAFQTIDLYKDDNAYAQNGAEEVSYRRGGLDLMTVRQENAMEEVLGPGNTSGQQWDSWWACFGARGEDGAPVAPFDAQTGAIDPAVVEAMAQHDIGARVRADPARYLPLFRERVRLIVGEEDNYFLEGAVRLLKEDLAKLSEERGETDAGRWIRLVDGVDHGTIWRSQEARAVPREMLEYFARVSVLGD